MRIRRSLCLLLILLLLAASQACNRNVGENDQYSPGSEAGFDCEFSKRDLDSSYDASADGSIVLSEREIKLNGKNLSSSDGRVVISAAGTYVISGSSSNCQIFVDASDTDKIQLVLNNASISCPGNPAIFAAKADKVFITLADGTANSVEDGADYAASGNEDGAIFSKCDLTINGTGALTVRGNYKHGIVSKDDLTIAGGSISVTAVKNGLSGKDCVKITSSEIKVESGGDGIRSDNDSNAAKGYIYIKDGDIQISAVADGIQAETALIIDGGMLDLVTGGGSANASYTGNGRPNLGWGVGDGMPNGYAPAHPDAGGGRHGGFDNGNPPPNGNLPAPPDGAVQSPDGTAAPAPAIINSDDASDTNEESSAKGLKAKSNMVISGGSINIDSLDDSIHGDENVTIEGGDITLSSGGRGIHADGDMVVNGGDIEVKKSYEGLEGTSVTINAGGIAINSFDDGINSAGGTDPTDNGFPGRDSANADEDCYIKICGGYIWIDADGDGIDSNGDFFVEGGTLLVCGPTSEGNGAIDYEGEALISGGAVIAVGSVGMAQGFSKSSEQLSINCRFNTVQPEGQAITIFDGSGKLVMSFVPASAYQSVVVSVPALNKGQTYTFYVGGEASDADEHGYAASGTLTGGQEAGNIET